MFFYTANINAKLKQKLMVSPACFHVFKIGLLDLFWACQGGLQLLTHLLGHFKVEGVAACSLNQKYSGIAAAPRTHCRKRMKTYRFRCLTRFFTCEIQHMQVGVAFRLQGLALLMFLTIEFILLSPNNFQ